MPFTHVAIRAAAVVDEACLRATARRIDVLLTLEHHEIKVPLALRLVLRHTAHERRMVHHLANVLVDEHVAAVSSADEYSVRTHQCRPSHADQSPSVAS